MRKLSNLVRSGLISGYLECVKALGKDPTPLLAEVGISLQQLDDPDQLLSFDSVSRLVELSAEHFSRSDFGLLMSHYQSPTILGVLGLLPRQYSDASTAIRELVRHYRHHNQGAEWQVWEESEYAFLIRHQLSQARTSGRQLTDLALCSGLKVLRSIFGPQWRPTWVSFTRSDDENSAAFRRQLQADIRYGQEFDGFVIPSKDLRTPIEGGDNNLKRMLEHYMASLDTDSRQDIGVQTRSLIRQNLGKVECNIASIARMLSVHPRTLQRMLADKGLSFKALLEEVRFARAQRLLEDTEMPLTIIAEHLGYAELSIFSRAFKKHFGFPPTQWRKNH